MTLQLRKDRYNRKLKKYHVVVAEDDEELSEDEERFERRDHEVQYKRQWYQFCVITSYYDCSCFPNHTLLSCNKLVQPHPQLQVDRDEVEHKRLGKARAASSGSEDDDSDKEANAKPVNTAQKDRLVMVGYTTRSCQTWLAT